MSTPAQDLDQHAELVKAQARKVVRCFHHYDSQQRADHAASHRLGHRQRKAVGEHFYVHPDLPGRAFPTRRAAARAAVQAMPVAERPVRVGVAAQLADPFAVVDQDKDLAMVEAMFS